MCCLANPFSHWNFWWEEILACTVLSLHWDCVITFTHVPFLCSFTKARGTVIWKLGSAWVPLYLGWGVDLYGLCLVVHSSPIQGVSEELQRNACTDSGTASAQDSCMWEQRSQLCTDVLVLWSCWLEKYPLPYQDRWWHPHKSKHLMLCDRGSVGRQL